MTQLLVTALMLMIASGCGKKAIAPAAAAAPTPPALAQMEIKPVTFEADGLIAPPAGSALQNTFTWQIFVARLRVEKIAELGLQSLFEMAGEKNSIAAAELRRSILVDLARGSSNATLRLQSSTYPGICSLAAWTNLWERLKITSGVDLLTSPPVITVGQREAQSSVTSMQTIVMNATMVVKGLEVMTTNLSFGQTFNLRVLDSRPDAVRLEMTARLDEFQGYAPNKKDPASDANIPLPIFKVSALGTRTDLRPDDVLLLGGPMEMSVQKTVDRVAYLSEVPALGRLFTKTMVETNFFRDVVIVQRVSAGP